MKQTARSMLALALRLGAELLFYILIGYFSGHFLSDYTGNRTWSVVITIFVALGIWVYRVVLVNNELYGKNNNK